MNPNRRSILAAALGLAAGATLIPGCGGDSTQAPKVELRPDLFYEPLAVCLADGESADTLRIFNFGETDLVWTPTRVPSGSSGLEEAITVAPNTVRLVPWSWTPTGSYPVQDTLRATTDDPNRPKAEVVFRREDPSVTDPDPVVPRAPLLAYPPDGAVFRLADLPDSTIQVGWSEEDPCSGVVEYEIHISTRADFGDRVCCLPRESSPLRSGTAGVLVEGAEDAGTVYWRVRAKAVLVDGIRKTTGPWSAGRRWTVEIP